VQRRRQQRAHLGVGIGVDGLLERDVQRRDGRLEVVRHVGQVALQVQAPLLQTRRPLDRMRATSSSIQNGLATKSAAPSSKARSRSARSVRAVSTMTGALVRCRTRSSTSKPSFSGSIRSSTTTSCGATAMRRAASAPLVDSSTSKPAARRPRTTPAAVAASSSTTSTRGDVGGPAW
jgi:hypothetical protein